MSNANERTSVEISNAAIVGAATDDRLLEHNPAVNGTAKVTARQWFALGDRVPYDRQPPSRRYLGCPAAALRPFIAGIHLLNVQQTYHDQNGK